MPDDKRAPNEFHDQIGNILIDTIGVCDGMEQLTARFYELFEGQHQALLDIATHKAPAGADLRQALDQMKRIARQGLRQDEFGNAIPFTEPRPKTE